MRADGDEILIHRLAAGELNAVEEERAFARVAKEPELAALLEELRDLQRRTDAAFPQPPPLGDRREFVALMERLTADDAEQPATYSLRASHDLRVEDRPGVTRYLMSSSLAQTTDDGAHLFHLREIPRSTGFPVELELYAGDILAVHSEVLLVSAFAGSYHPTPGSVFGAIAKRFGISFASGPPPGVVPHPHGLLHFRGVSCPAFDSLWVLEMRHPGQQLTRKDLGRALGAIGRSLPDMLAEASSITLPLLGTGYERLDPREVARELLSVLPRWAKHPQLRTVRVFAHRLEHVAILNRALDERDYEAVNSGLVAACRELQARLESGVWSEPVRAALKDLLHIASVRDPSLSSIALEGRRVAETVLRELTTRGSEEAAPLRAPLQLLLSYGAAAAAGESISSNAAMSILYAAIGAADEGSARS